MTGPEPPMQFRRHSSATCPNCDVRLWYGLKSEATGWNVYYECSDCQFETCVGRVALAEVEDTDAAVELAREMGERV